MVDNLASLKKTKQLSDHMIEYVKQETDPLTGALSLCGFYQFVPEFLKLLRRKDDIDLIYLNIEDFKAFNARNGYDRGTEILLELVNVIAKVYSERLICRAYSDRFIVMCYASEAERGIRKINRIFAERCPSEGLVLKAGICRIDIEHIDVAASCDSAKIAADSIRKKYGVLFRYYDQELSDAIRKQRYIVENLDREMREKCIRAYYQPVVRTLTGEVCGMEALVRWEDERYGLIRPDILISTLEEYQLIHMLDVFMIRQVCAEFEEEQKRGEKMVPVSFNLSRLDFELCDIFRIVDDAVTSHHVPKNMIHVEITESVFNRNPEFIQEKLRLFHDAGYEVWMDDFGSGYSSLNVLKDYDFDVIKIDMLFLRNFSDKSKRIISSIIDMAKDVGIRTLAEGVESNEQLAFLRSIGCEKIQGYLIGKPLPPEEVREDLSARNFRYEENGMRGYYDDLGQINLLSVHPLEHVFSGERQDWLEDLSDTDHIAPIAIWEKNGSRGRFLLTNRPFRCELKSIEGHSPRSAEFEMNDEAGLLYRKVQDFMAEMRRDREMHDVCFMAGGSYCRVRGRLISMYGERSAYVVTIRNLSSVYSLSKGKQIRTEKMLRALYGMFDALYVMGETPEQDDLLYVDVDCWENRAFCSDTASFREHLKKQWIFPEDRERFLCYVRRDGILNRVRNSEREVLEDYFRFTDDSGRYQWKAVVMRILRQQAGNQILIGIRKTGVEQVDNYTGLSIGCFKPVSMKKLQELSRAKRTQEDRALS